MHPNKTSDQIMDIFMKLLLLNLFLKFREKLLYFWWNSLFLVSESLPRTVKWGSVRKCGYLLLFRCWTKIFLRGLTSVVLYRPGYIKVMENKRSPESKRENQRNVVILIPPDLTYL